MNQKKVYVLNFLARFIFLLITPVFFQYFALGFIWHSIYWGVITCVVLIWSFFIVFSPLIGRIGCGWFCFMGTINDFVGKHAAIRTKWRKPLWWARLLILMSFLLSAFAFYFLNTFRGITHDWAVEPFFLRAEFSTHYKIFWMTDVFTALVLALVLDKRWFCKNLCAVGLLCSLGARYSRLLPVIDTGKCIQCHTCERECPAAIPLMKYLVENKGLVTNPECILCGKCVHACPKDALRIRFVGNRKKFKSDS